MLSMIGTALNVLFHPVDFFNALSEKYSIKEALVFYLVLLIIIPLTVGLLLTVFMAVFLHKVTLLTPLILILPAIIYIAVSIAGIFIVSLVMHIFVLIFRGKGGYAGTFNVIVYSSAATLIFQILASILMITVAILKSFGSFIPLMIVLLIGSLWIVAIPIIGYVKIHKMGAVRAVVTFLFPVIIFAIFAILISPSKLDRVKTIAGFLKPAKTGIGNVPHKTAIRPLGAAGKINWQNNLDVALRSAQREGKIVMADFYTDWCHWCKKLDNEVYSDARVAELSAQFICAKIDADKDRDSVNKYMIRGYPTIIFFDGSGNEKGRIPGYIGSEELLDKMKGVLQKNALSVAALPVSLGDKIKKELTEKRFVLHGIAYDINGSSAVINDNIYRVGDIIEGAKIVEITKTRVRLLEKNGAETIIQQ